MMSAKSFLYHKKKNISINLSIITEMDQNRASFNASLVKIRLTRYTLIVHLILQPGGCSRGNVQKTPLPPLFIPYITK